MDPLSLSDFSSQPSILATDVGAILPNSKMGDTPIKQVPREGAPRLAKTEGSWGHFNDDVSSTTSEAVSLGSGHTITPVSWESDDEEGSCYSDGEATIASALSAEGPEVTQKSQLFLDLAHDIADDVQDGVPSEEIESVRSGTAEQQQLAQAYDKCREHVVTALKDQHETDAIFWADLTKTIRDVVVESKKEASAVNGKSRVPQLIHRTIENYECAMEEKAHGRELQGQKLKQVAAYTKRAVELLKQEHSKGSHVVASEEESLGTAMVESLDQLARDEKELETAPGIRCAVLKKNIRQTWEALKLYDHASRGDEAASSALFEGRYSKEVDYFTGCIERLSMSTHDVSGSMTDGTVDNIAEEMRQALHQLADYKQQLEALPRSNQAIDKGASDPVNTAHLLRLAIKQTFKALDCYDQASEEENSEQLQDLLQQAAMAQEAAGCFQESVDAVQKAFGVVTFVTRKLANKDLEEPHYSDRERGEFLQQAQDHYEEGMGLLGLPSEDESQESFSVDEEESSVEGDMASQLSADSYLSDDNEEEVSLDDRSEVCTVPSENEGAEEISHAAVDLLSEAEFSNLAEPHHQLAMKALLHGFSLLSQGDERDISRFQELGKMAQEAAQNFQEAAEMMKQAQEFTTTGTHQQVKECYQQAHTCYGNAIDLVASYMGDYDLEMQVLEREVVPEVSTTSTADHTYALVKARLPEGGFQTEAETSEYLPATYEEALEAMKPFNSSEEKWVEHINSHLEKGANPDLISALQKYRAHAIELYQQGDYDMACFMAQSVKNIEQSIEYSIHAQEPGDPSQAACWDDAAQIRVEMDYYETQYVQIPASLDLFAERIRRALGGVIEQAQESLHLYLEAESLFAEGKKSEGKKAQKAAMGLHERTREMADKITTGTNYLYSLLEPKN